MAIVFSCTCGKPLKAKDEMAGKKTKCPHCGAVLPIPTAASKAGSAVAMDPNAVPVDDIVWPTLEANPGGQGTEAAAAAPGAGAPPSDAPAPRPSDLPRPTDGTLQYKVLSQKDHSSSGKVNFLRLEEVVNEHARQGWIVKSSFVINVPGHIGNHDELVLILER